MHCQVEFVMLCMLLTSYLSAGCGYTTGRQHGMQQSTPQYATVNVNSITCTLLSSMQALMHPSPSLQSTPCCWHCCRRLASAQRLKAAKMTYSARKQVCRRHCCSLLSQNDVRLPQRKAVQQSVPLPSTPCSLAVAPHVYSRAAHLLRQTQRLCCLCCKQVPTG